MSETTDRPYRRDDIINASERTADALTDEQVKLLDLLASGTNAYQIQVYDADPFHIGYYDKSHRDVNNAALMLMAENGLVTMHAGVRKLEHGDEYVKHAWIESKPRAYYEENDLF